MEIKYKIRKEYFVNNLETICERINQSIEIKKNIINDNEVLNVISSVVDVMVETITNGGKILVCGNGGSASDALHMVGEIVGRFQRERKSWPAIALNADVSTMTAIANDYGYDFVFERAVEAYMTSKDIIIGISTSGNSENIYRAIVKAKKIGGRTVALLGKDGGKLKKNVDYPIVVSCDITARVQEAHITIIHILCELLEERLFHYNRGEN